MRVIYTQTYRVLIKKLILTSQLVHYIPCYCSCKDIDLANISHFHSKSQLYLIICLPTYQNLLKDIPTFQENWK